MKFKYIIIQKGHEERPILCSIFLDHSFLRNSIHAMYPGIQIISAGFCRFSEGKWHCWGKSVGLSLLSRNEIDSDILNADYEFEGL